MKRDYKRREVSAHFAHLRLCLNAMRKNEILPDFIQEKAAFQLHSLPRDSCFTRIKKRCTLTARRRGVNSRWRISRIFFRKLADYNQLSGVQWACWISNTKSTRKFMKWPPPPGYNTILDYIKAYYENSSDEIVDLGIRDKN